MFDGLKQFTVKMMEKQQTTTTKTGRRQIPALCIVLISTNKAFMIDWPHISAICKADHAPVITWVC